MKQLKGKKAALYLITHTLNDDIKWDVKLEAINSNCWLHMKATIDEPAGKAVVQIRTKSFLINNVPEKAPKNLLNDLINIITLKTLKTIKV